MATVIPIGEPVNEAERQAIRRTDRMSGRSCSPTVNGPVTTRSRRSFRLAHATNP